MFRSLESLRWLIAIGLCPSSREFNILSFLKTRMPVVTIYCVKHLYGKRILICKINGSTMHPRVKGRPNFKKNTTNFWKIFCSSPTHWDAWLWCPRSPLPKLWNPWSLAQGLGHRGGGYGHIHVLNMYF